MSIEILNVTDWVADYEHGIFPIGARSKEMIYSPKCATGTINPSWPYLFKRSRNAYPDQFWMETIAYMIGTAMGIKVPLALPGFKITEDEGTVCGSVIEWFYEPSIQNFVHAADYFEKRIKNFDSKTGQQHNIFHLKVFCRSLNQKFILSPNWEK